MKCIKCGVELPEGSIYCHMCGKKQVREKRKALKRANGTGSVYKLQGRRRRPWVAAKNRVIIGYYETKTSAMEALERLTGRTLDERYNMTFADVFQAWKEEHFPSIGEKSHRAYLRSYDVFAPLHNKQFRSLRTADFQAVLDPHLTKSHSAVSKYKILLTQMSEWAVREEICTTNFAKFVRLNENTTKEKQVFTEAEIEAIRASNRETAKIILMLIYTGMRIGELFSLRKEDFHGTYVVGGSKTEAGRNRIIPIRAEGIPLFEYFSQVSDTLLLDGYVGQHTPDNFRRRDYYPLLDDLGIPRKPPHVTRHTFTSWAVKSGVKPEILQKILGHQDYSTTANIYTHVDAETLVRAINENMDVPARLLTNENNEKKENPLTH